MSPGFAGQFGLVAKEAIRCYDRALKIDPQFTDALENKRLLSGLR